MHPAGCRGDFSERWKVPAIAGESRGPRGDAPPFFFVLPKKNAPCTVEEKGAVHTLWLRQRVDRGSPQTVQ